MKKLIVLGAALLLLCSSSSVGAVTAANVDTTQGSVDVTPLGATESSDGTVVYSYQVSLLPIFSSDHIQTANSFTVTVPALVKDTKFTLIGTHEMEVDQNGEYTPSHKPVAKPVEVSVPLGKQDAKTYYDDDSDHSLPSYNLIAAGNANSENKVLDFNGVNPEVINEGYESYDVKQYGLVSTVRYPVAVRVDLVVDKEVAKQNPRLAVDVRNTWRSFSEAVQYSGYNDGAQSLEDYRRTLGEYSPSYRYVGEPSLIKPGSFDNDGLHLAGDIAITKATGDWSHIGRDVSPGFNYVDTFQLHRNVAVQYIAPEYEDLADVAVVEYVPSTEPSSTPPSSSTDSSTEPSSTPPSSSTDSSTEPTSTSPSSSTDKSTEPSSTTEPPSSTSPDGTDTSVDSSQAGGSKAKQHKVLPTTGEQVSVWLVALGLLILVVAVFIYRRKKSDKR